MWRLNLFLEYVHSDQPAFSNAKVSFSVYFSVFVVTASCTTALAQSVVDPAPTYPTCTYGNRIKGTQKKFPCRVITNGKEGEVIFIEEYSGKLPNSKTVARHDG